MVSESNINPIKGRKMNVKKIVKTVLTLVLFSASPALCAPGLAALDITKQEEIGFMNSNGIELLYASETSASRTSARRGIAPNVMINLGRYRRSNLEKRWERRHGSSRSDDTSD